MKATDFYERAELGLVLHFQSVWEKAGLKWDDAHRKAIGQVISDIVEGIEKDYISDLDSRVEELERLVEKIRNI